MSEFNLSNPNRTIHVGVILMNSVTEALDVAPVDLLHGVSQRFIEDMPTLIPEPFKTQGLPIDFHWDSFAKCPPLDIVLVGAHHIDYRLSDAELAFVRKSYDACTAFMTVCGGIQVAVQAGLVDGKTVTGPRFMLSELRAAAPDATAWVEKRFVSDGKLWTSGALHNGLDMMAAFMRHTWPGKEGGMPSLVDFGLVLGSGLNRDIDYKDEPLLEMPVA
ncbi:ThiJ/PfpI [Cordyceps fumosorosea ARSEF 2679]|uniref:ThiJ/PfpI n=1 Tax=Cordyceps fumosorosea (strain ARSEF 2679) TaxID=1081104 RepID=A0A167NND9_CORFA|nr:ThiJ/PfpI [Cordyceps fumosorosea ARSEF 2679]OAA55749.1 ThiJ/PfpI [Cordyceps fumosorosea ARSEF 2679]